MRWDGKENGELLKLMLEKGFEVFVSGDKNIPYQQNFQKYPIPVLVLDALDNTYETIRLFAPKIEQAIEAGLLSVLYTKPIYRYAEGCLPK